MATLKQVAAHAEVSVQTVSNALNAPQRLRPDTLERVNRSIELLNYRPNRNARSLRTSAVELIGYCVPNWPNQTHLVMDQFLHALCAAAEGSGRHILLFTAPAGVDGMPVYDDLHARRTGRRVRALADRDPRSAARLAEGPEDPVRVLRSGLEGDHPARPVGRRRRRGRYRRGGPAPARDRPPADRLPRLAQVVRPGRGPSRRLAQRNARSSACRTAGLAVRCREDSIDEGARATADLLDSDRPPDGIVALSDILALGALRELSRRGLTPGRDVGITGFDDSPLADVVSPGLTSLRQPMDRIAAELIAILTAADTDATGRSGPTGVPTERLLQPELVIRGSSAPG